MYTEEQIATLEANLKAVTDRMDGVDLILKANKLGKNVVMAFRCNHSGLLLPADYVKEWGLLYGTGLGPSPVSEVLDSDYSTNPPDISSSIRGVEQIMHPVQNCAVQVDLVYVDAQEMAASAAVLAKDDPYMDKRARIVRAKQLANPRGKLRLIQAAWEKAGR